MRTKNKCKRNPKRHEWQRENMQITKYSHVESRKSLAPRESFWVL